MMTSSASVPTTSGSKYLQQLCKHWSHRLSVEFSPDEGKVIFPGDATVTMTARSDALDCRIEANAKSQLAQLKGVLSQHLDRFAFREAPLTFEWQDD